MGQLGQVDFAELCGHLGGHLLVETVEVAGETKPGDARAELYAQCQSLLGPLCPMPNLSQSLPCPCRSA